MLGHALQHAHVAPDPLLQIFEQHRVVGNRADFHAPCNLEVHLLANEGSQGVRGNFTAKKSHGARRGQ